jgi:ABC-type multidrug transport system fused ATPase/permease subunit
MKKIFLLFKLIFKIIDKKFKKLFFINILFNLFSNFIQVLGLSSAIPFITILINPELVQTNKYLNTLYNNFNFQSIDSFIFFIGSVFLILIVIGNFLIAITTFLQVYISQVITKNLQYKLINFYFNKNYSELLDQNSTQKRSNLTISDSLDNKFFFPLTEIIPKITMAIILFSISIYFFTLLTFISIFLIILILTIFSLKIKKKLNQTGKEIAKSNYLLNKIMFESFQMIRIIIINQVTNFFTKDIKKIHYKLIKYNSFSHGISQIPKIVLETLLFVLVISISLLTYKIESSKLVLTLSFYAIFGYKLFPNISHAYSYFTIIKSAINSFDFLIKDLILYLDDKNKEENNLYNLNFNKINSIQIQLNKRFKYGKNIILNKQKINFYPEKLNIIFGPSGGGKSTIINMLMGLIINKSIEVKINNIILGKNSFKNFHKIIGYVPQKFELIDNTIENNVKLGKYYSKKEFEKCLKICRLLNFYKIFKTRKKNKIGENNNDISGGQAQRISIARAIIKKPKILILDEGTSQLDKDTEFRIINSLIKENYTIILITHRYYNLKKNNYMKYFKLEKNKLIEVE